MYPDRSRPEANAESAPIDAERLSTYGLHKYLAEVLVRHHAKRWLIFRMGGFVGPGLKKNAVFDLLHGHPLRCHPASLYQFIDTRDLARVVFASLEAETEGEIYNISGDGTLALNDIIALLPPALRRPQNQDLPRDHCEINLDKIKTRFPLPRTADTVQRFLAEALGE